MQELNEVYPNKGESKKDFIARFMSATKDEYPDTKQRFAICMSYWDRRKKHLKEEFLIEGSPIYTTDTPYEIKRMIINNNKLYRIDYDRNLDRYFICDINRADVTHIDMIAKASEFGYYDKKMNILQAQEYMINNVDCYRSAPLTDKTGFLITGSEGFNDKYYYDTFAIEMRDMTPYGGSTPKFEDTELFKVLGKYNNHKHADHFTYGIDTIESLKEDFKEVETRPFELEDLLYWYNPDEGTCNAIIDYKGKKTRVRAGLLVINDNQILLCKDNNKFDIPGGSIEIGESIIEAAKRETQEEVHITAKNIEETGFDYCTVNDELEPWVAENVPIKYQWYNYYTCLCIGKYDKEYRGHIDAIDQDPKMNKSAEWYNIDSVIDNPDFLEPWKKALEKFGYLDKTLTEDLKDDAKNYFGITNNWKVANYINTDGTLLDGSGKKLGSNGTQRSIDHREISDIFTDIDGTEAMLVYMRDGNIRFMPEAPGFDLIEEPTEAQYNTIKAIINKLYDTYYLDISDTTGKVISSSEYTYKDRDKIIDDIKSHFRATRTDLDLTKNKIEALLGMPYEEALDLIKEDILAICADNYINIKINDIDFTGSQRFGKPRKDSDLDVAFSYSDIDDNIREDDLFNILNEEPLYLEGYQLDINPLKDEDLGWYIDNASRYKKESLHEDTRNTLINKSRGAGAYKDTTRGKNRFERKRLSRVSNTVKEFNQINMDEFFKKDLLTINIPVIGETDSYKVAIRLDGVLKEIANNIKSNGNKFEYKTVLQALTKVFNTTNVYVNCTCADYKYRFDHWNIVNNVSTSDSAHDPGPGKGVANPNDDKGRGCKHILLVLNNTDWIMKATSVIHNYINWIDEHEPKLFAKLIFPKLYGMSEEDAVDKGLLPEDTKLATDKDIIDKINEWAKNRGKYQPGSNKNPVSEKQKAKEKNSTND